MRLAPVLAALTAPALVAGCTQALPPLGTGALGAARLQPFDSCSELLDYFREQALELVGPYGLGHDRAVYLQGVEDVSTMATAAESAAGDGAGGGAGPEFSGTNNQEVGVDEADIVKTDGRIIVTSLTEGVRIVSAETGKVLSTIDLPVRSGYGAEILLNGVNLIVLATEWPDSPSFGPADSWPAFTPSRTVVTRVDLSDPAAPVTLGSIRVEGTYRSARMVGDSVRMVMVSEPPGLAFTHPQDGSLRAEDEAEAANRAVIAESTIEDWLPHRQVLDADGQVQGTEALLGCDEVSRPREFSGLSTLSVLTFDISGDSVAPTSEVGVVATGDTVYASTDRVVVATSPWDVWSWGWSERMRPQDGVTDLHTFDISEPDHTSYIASGSVAGRLVNQFALDEDDGIIRVATTTGDGSPGDTSQSSLVVLREEDGQLEETGRVDGLGVTEQIHSVRYLSADLAAVVTFRQVDPLYLVDTSEPTAPRVLGELKIPGYSAYLHAVGEDLLLGVGQDADPETGMTHGLQISLFDIGDPANPRRVSQVTWPNAYSPVEWDHRAFRYWEPTGQVLLPAEWWTERVWEGQETEPGPEDMFTGVLSVRLDGQHLTEGPSASTMPDEKQWGEVPLRTIVIGDDLWALTYQTLHRFDLATLASRGVTALG